MLGGKLSIVGNSGVVFTVSFDETGDAVLLAVLTFTGTTALLFAFTIINFVASGCIVDAIEFY